MTNIHDNPIEQFAAQVAENVKNLGSDPSLRADAVAWIDRTNKHAYTYNFSFLGRPIIQFPQDMVAVQELIWNVRPDLIIETGIAHGGSLIMSAAMLAMLEYCDAAESGKLLDPSKPRRHVLGIDIDIRAHNRRAINDHPMSSRIEMIEGSSIDPAVIARVHERAASAERVLVCLDSNHTHDHVLAELEAYAPLVSPGSYCVVFDTLIEDMPASSFMDRPWDKGNNPKTAVHTYLKSHPEFEIDHSIDNKLLISVAPEGYLRRVR